MTELGDEPTTAAEDWEAGSRKRPPAPALHRVRGRRTCWNTTVPEGLEASGQLIPEGPSLSLSVLFFCLIYRYSDELFVAKSHTLISVV